MRKNRLFLIIALISCLQLTAQVNVDLGYDWNSSAGSLIKATSETLLSAGKTSYLLNEGLDEEVSIEIKGGGTVPSADKKSVYKNGTSENVAYLYLTVNQTQYIEGKVTPTKKIASIKLNGTSSDTGKGVTGAILFSDNTTFDEEKITGYASFDLAICRAGNDGVVLSSIPEGTLSFRIYRTVNLIQNDAYHKIDATGEVVVGGNNGNIRLAYLNISVAEGTPATTPTLSLVSGSEDQSIFLGFDIEPLVFRYGGTANAFVINWKDEQTQTPLTAAPEGISVDLSVEKTATISGSPTTPGVYSLSVKATAGSSQETEAITAQIEVKSLGGKKTMAYVTDPDKATGDAPFRDELAKEFALTVVSSKATGTDYSSYDIIVLSAQPNSGDAGIAELKTVVLNKPFLNMKTFQWQANRWNWITGQANSQQTSLTVPTESQSHPVFKDSDTSAPIQLSTGSGVNALVRFDNVLFATTGTTKVLGQISDGESTYPSYIEIPTGSTLNGMESPTAYPMILLGLSEASWGTATEAAIQIAVNAAKYLVDPDKTSISDNIVPEGNASVIGKEYFDVTGRRIPEDSAKGLVIQKFIYDNDTYVFKKTYIR